jgi:hypothetical protein
MSNFAGEVDSALKELTAAGLNPKIAQPLSVLNEGYQRYQQYKEGKRNQSQPSQQQNTEFSSQNLSYQTNTAMDATTVEAQPSPKRA